MKHFNSSLIASIVAGLVLATPVFAQSVTATASVTSGTMMPVGVSARAARLASTTAARAVLAESALAKAIANANQQIEMRVASLNQLGTRIQAMAHLTADEKTSIAGIISGDLSSLGDLQAKIDSDATSSVKADIQSITKGERIYMLVEPQTNILAAADRAASIGDMLTALAGKIETRLSATPNATASSLLADLQAKVADAQTQASAAISETSTPPAGQRQYDHRREQHFCVEGCAEQN